MYRLVVVTLTILSVSENGAANELELKWSLSGRNDQTQEISSRVLKGTLLELADAQIADKMKYYEFSLASEVAEDVSRSFDEERSIMYELLMAFAALKGIKKDIKDRTFKCNQADLDRLIKFEKQMDQALGGRLDKIDSDLGLFMVKEYSWIAEKYFNYCMPELKDKFDAESSNPYFKEKLDRTREFEIFIDEKRAAQKQGSPRYCNDEVQKIDWVSYWKLASRVGTEAGERPLIIRDNTSYFEAEKRKAIMRKFFTSTCDDVWFYNQDDYIKFIMSAKRSVKFNRESISIFDCGKTMGRYQLCNEAIAKFFKFL